MRSYAQVTHLTSPFRVSMVLIRTIFRLWLSWGGSTSGTGKSKMRGGREEAWDFSSFKPSLRLGGEGGVGRGRS